MQVIICTGVFLYHITRDTAAAVKAFVDVGFTIHSFH